METTLHRATRALKNVVTIGGDVTAETRLREDLGFDSLDQVSAVIEVEHEFGVQISDDDADTFRTVGDIVKFIDGRTA